MLTETNGFEWQITSRKKETHNVYTYTLSPVSNSQRFSFEVGQFVMLGTILNRPTTSGKMEESFVQRAYSISSSPLRELLDITIKDEKPYGYINPKTGKADAFAPYFFEQIRIGDKVRIKLNEHTEHFMWKVAKGLEKDIAYWSGSNGAESSRSLIQFMQDTKDPNYRLMLFYSNPNLHLLEDNSIDVIYYDWLIDMIKKLDNLMVVFTFTRDRDIPDSDHPRLAYRKGRFFVNQAGTPEKTLSTHHTNVRNSFNPICGSSAFINGTIRLPDGKIKKGKGIMQDLLEIEGISPDKIDKEQFYLQQSVR
jgi:hypothetical protein